jgi:hypothetical protein
VEYFVNRNYLNGKTKCHVLFLQKDNRRRVTAIRDLDCFLNCFMMKIPYIKPHPGGAPTRRLTVCFSNENTIYKAAPKIGWQNKALQYFILSSCFVKSSSQ